MTKVKKKFYITAAIPYVNGSPHIGHALEFVQTDTVARYRKILGFETLFNCGSDENGLKIVRAASEQKLTPQQLADKNTKKFTNFAKALSVKIDTWIQGSDKKRHWPGTEKLWRLGQKNGDIYKKLYGGYYCVGCEDFYTPKDLVEGKCPEHLKKPEWVEEENYFFRLSRYQQQIEKLVESNAVKVIPEARKKEVVTFIKKGLKDFSISRSRKRAQNWGIPVPGDKSQVIYTWYDALNVYQTTIGFGINEAKWKKWWPADVHVIGKGIQRFHAVYWIGMLLSAKLPLPKSIFVHGYISSGGVKMSKSLGNVIDPFEVVEKYGAEATRYYLLREIPAYTDGDFTYSRFEQLYQADLANGLGNLVSRVAKLCERSDFGFGLGKIDQLTNDVDKHLTSFRFDFGLQSIWKRITKLDKQIDKTEPWKLEGERLETVLNKLVKELRQIGYDLQPFLPETARKIIDQFKGLKIQASKPLFPRLKR